MSDLISREETYKILCEEYPLLQKDYLKRVIDKVPSAERKGKWIPNHDGSWNCSECGLRVLVYAKGNFCPNCGAHMEGEEE